jgi:hypothetical protein
MFYVYAVATGALVSVASVVELPLPDGLAAKERPEADWATQVWDAATADLIARPVAVRRTIDKTEFLRRLTLPTLATVLAREGTDPLIAALRVWIDNVTRVDLDTVEVQQGIAYLQSLGVLTATHAAAILADGAA